jgi:L-aspartate oxidase
VALPGVLAAPRSTWERTTEVAILGSGAAGLAAAIAARPARDVLIITKDTLDAGSTAWAQGGLAAVLDPSDSLEEHVADTLAAGAGLCDEAAVRRLVAAAPGSIRALMGLGAEFDPAEDGGPALTREGGHSHRRIVHAGGDQSGAEVQRTLDEAALAAGAQVLEQAFALDLLIGIDPQGRRAVAGVRVGMLDDAGTVRSVGIVRARAVIVATGGYGQVFASTSNPPAVTGDGLALALRAGVEVRDLEFVQFHPTVLWQGPEARGQQALISEAVRGEGAVLYDGLGRRVMAGVHPLEDLAPRDVVAAAISRCLQRAPGGIGDHVFLDASPIGERFPDRFPSITAACRRLGIDPVHDRIPVAPAAHYACGGIAADLDGTTSLAGLFAVGEVSATGVHGANRLASNSLTEGVVSGTLVGTQLADRLPGPVTIDLGEDGRSWFDPVDGPLMNPAWRLEVRSAMSSQVGVLRDAEGLESAADRLASLASMSSQAVTGSCRAWEATNVLTVASGVVAAARVRTESRGCHRRSDWTEPRAEWVRHLDVSLVDGDMVVTGAPDDAAVMS